MNMTLDDVQWLEKHQSRLAAGLNVPAVVGTLEISSYYDKETLKIVTGPVLYLRMPGYFHCGSIRYRHTAGRKRS